MQKSTPHRNRVFQLNKNLITLSRKLMEPGEVNQSLHFATLLHKMTTYLLEFETIGQMVTAVELIYSDEFTDKVLHFIEHTDSFVQFGIRMFQHFTLSAKLRALIISKPDRLLGLVTGLLRTNNYEPVVASLSLLSVLIERQDCHIFAGKHSMLLQQMIRLLCKHEIEYTQVSLIQIPHSDRATACAGVETLRMSDGTRHSGSTGRGAGAH